MGKWIDLTGQRFGRLTVIERAGDRISPSGTRASMWLCQCECGNTVIVEGGSLRSGDTKSCGCLLAELAAKRQYSHRMSDSKIYEVWKSMRQRCTNKKRVESAVQRK